VRGGAAARDKPPAKAFEKPALARTPPAAPKVGYEAQKPLLEAKPGKPIDDVDRRELGRTKAVPPPAVKVIAAPQEPPKILPPPAATSAQRPDKTQGGRDDRKAVAPVPATAPSPAAATAVPAAHPGKAPANRDDRRAAPVPAPAAAPPATSAQAVKPPAKEASAPGQDKDDKDKGKSQGRADPGSRK